MNRILITGASGNVGYEVIRGLKEIGSGAKIIAGDYNVDRAKDLLAEFEDLEYRQLDFADPTCFGDALEGINIVFLLRPPQLADVPKYFDPFITAMQTRDINKIVFLSVQGVEDQKRIPHHMLEQLILEKELDHTFLRPSYFMQNLTSTLLKEIREENRIFIPSGKLKMTWVDARDIGLVAAHVLDKFESYKNQALVITGNEQKDFNEVAGLLTEKLGRKISYCSPNLLRFFMRKRRTGVKPMMILVMIMLHYLPRFSKKLAPMTDTVDRITGQAPGSLEAFIDRTTERFS